MKPPRAASATPTYNALFMLIDCSSPGFLLSPLVTPNPSKRQSTSGEVSVD
jgi:hypothetical protein